MKRKSLRREESAQRGRLLAWSLPDVLMLPNTTFSISQFVNMFVKANSSSSPSISPTSYTTSSQHNQRIDFLHLVQFYRHVDDDSLTLQLFPPSTDYHTNLYPLENTGKECSFVVTKTTPILDNPFASISKPNTHPFFQI